MEHIDFDITLDLIKEGLFRYSSFLRRFENFKGFGLKVKSIKHFPMQDPILHKGTGSHWKKTSLEVVKSKISYEENLRLSSLSNILIDIADPKHNGLSFRTMDAIRC